MRTTRNPDRSCCDETHVYGRVHWQARQASVATAEVLQAGALAAIAQNQVFELNGLAGDLGVYAVASDGTLTRIAAVGCRPSTDPTGWRGSRST
jgi:hypothetical protein